MRVRDICQIQVATVQPATPAIEAARLMVALNVGSVVVLRDGAVCGILTDRDIVARGVRHGRDVRDLPVSELMTPNPVVVRADDDLGHATTLMAERGVRRLPVVEDDGRLTGFLALDDVIVLVGDEMANLRGAVTAAIAR
jgi:CBS domain-containing protein